MFSGTGHWIAKTPHIRNSMCGVAAILKAVDVACPAGTLDRMRDEVSYRGPDDQDSVFLTHFGCRLNVVTPQCSSWKVGLAHRRLSILDLSQAAHQPMGYRAKYWTVYNGEIYNFIELRTELQRSGHVFRSSSDTEVALAAYAEWGPSCFARFRGMWAIVIVDFVRNEMILCRDRLGIKPLYLWQKRGMIAVVSEIKQLRHIPGFTARLNSDSAQEYLRTGYEDPERTFFEQVEPIKSGRWIRISLDRLTVDASQEYWHPERISASITDAAEAGRVFAEKARECVRLYLRSDVPVGCALSGGLDSSTIAVLASALRNGQEDPFHTFTVTFPDHPTDERQYAETVAAEIQSIQHFVTPNPERFLADLDHFLWIHEEPVGSLSVYAGYCLARLASETGVTVVLNGQGGDEILSGYWQSYFLYLLELWRRRRFFSLAGHFLGALVAKGNPNLVAQVPTMITRYRARRRSSLETHFKGLPRNGDRDVLSWILALDGQSRRIQETRTLFLPRLLKWEDRNSMAYSVEGRYPFLDHELIDLCLAFVPQILYHNGWTKYPLRIGLRKELPARVLWRRSKFGFETPQDEWLCGSLRPPLERWLKTTRPIWDYVDRTAVQQLAEQTWRLKGRQDEPGQALFRAFTFDKWLDLFKVQF